MPHPGRVLGIILLGACLGMTAWSLVSLIVPGSEQLPDRPTIFDFLWFSVIFLVFPAVGAAVVWKRPENMVGWMFLLVGLLLVSSVFASEYAGREAYTGVTLPGSLAVAWVGNVAWLLASGIALPLALATFPTGRHLGARWRTGFRLTTLAVAVVVLAAVLRPVPLEGYEGYFANPFGTTGPIGDAAMAMYDAGTAVLILPLGMAIASLLVRFRRATGVERQQLKWLVPPSAVVIVGIVVAAITEHETAWSVMLLGLAAVPIAAGAAILRYRLYDIDLVIRRTLVYGGVVGVLAITYVSLVLVLQTALSQVTGNDTVPVAVSTVAIAALFGPLRARVQRAVDRRFYRSRYDAQGTVDAFVARLRGEVELEPVGAALVRAAADTVAPRAVALWLRGPGTVR